MAIGDKHGLPWYEILGGISGAFVKAHAEHWVDVAISAVIGGGVGWLVSRLLNQLHHKSINKFKKK